MGERRHWCVAESVFRSGHCLRFPGSEKRLIHQGRRDVSDEGKAVVAQLEYGASWSSRESSPSPFDSALSPLPYLGSAPPVLQYCQKSRAPFLCDVVENGGRRSRYACVSRQRLSTRLARQQVPERAPVEFRVSSSDTDFALSCSKRAYQMLWHYHPWLIATLLMLAWNWRMDSKRTIVVVQERLLEASMLARSHGCKKSIETLGCRSAETLRLNRKILSRLPRILHSFATADKDVLGHFLDDVVKVVPVV